MHLFFNNRHPISFHFLFVVLIMMALLAGGEKSGYAQTKTIRFVTLNWEPYYGKDLMNNGYCSDIVRAACKRAGYDITIDFVPWKRALYEARNLYFDALLGIFYSDERSEWLYYSDSFSESEMVLFALQGREISWEVIKDLKPYRIGIENGYAYSPEFDAADFLQKKSVRKLELNINNLLEGRIDLIAASQKRLLFWVNANQPEIRRQLRIVPKPISSNKLYVAFPKAHPKAKTYVEAFNEGLRQIRNDNTYETILATHGF